jgi:hypothetical protein
MMAPTYVRDRRALVFERTQCVWRTLTPIHPSVTGVRSNTSLSVALSVESARTRYLGTCSQLVRESQRAAGPDHQVVRSISSVVVGCRWVAHRATVPAAYGSRVPYRAREFRGNPPTQRKPTTTNGFHE